MCHHDNQHHRGLYVDQHSSMFAFVDFVDLVNGRFYVGVSAFIKVQLKVGNKLQMAVLGITPSSLSGGLYREFAILFCSLNVQCI